MLSSVYTSEGSKLVSCPQAWTWAVFDDSGQERNDSHDLGGQRMNLSSFCFCQSVYLFVWLVSVIYLQLCCHFVVFFVWHRASLRSPGWPHSYWYSSCLSILSGLDYTTMNNISFNCCFLHDYSQLEIWLRYLQNDSTEREILLTTVFAPFSKVRLYFSHCSSIRPNHSCYFRAF